MAGRDREVALGEIQPEAVSGQPPAAPGLPVAQPGEWGRVQLRVYNPWRDAGVLGTGAGLGTGIAAFYSRNARLMRRAISRAVERTDRDNPDQRADPEIGLAIEVVGSLLVPVIFHSKLGYDYFTSILNGPFLKSCLKAELDQIGYREPLDVSVEKWELPNHLEGMMKQLEIGNKLNKVDDKVNLHSSTAGDSGIPEDVSSPSGLSIFSTEEDQQGMREDATPSRRRAQSYTQRESPQKRLAVRLKRHSNSPTAKAMLRAYSVLEKGAAILTSSGYQEGEGVRYLLEGLVLMEEVLPGDVETVLYAPHWLNLSKTQLNQLIVTQLQANPDSTTYLLLQALQLPAGDERLRAMNRVIDVVLLHGQKDALYKDIAYIYFALCSTLWTTTKQAAPTLSACASALMHNPSHLSTLFYTARSSMTVSVPQAIRQLEHFIHTAPPCHDLVPRSHYYLVRLYGQQSISTNWDKILYHYSIAQQTENNRLPVFGQVSRVCKDQARKVYQRVVAEADK